MPETFQTEETYAAEINASEMGDEVALKIKAGAVHAEYTKNSDGSWTLTTTWNVIDE